MIRPMMRKTTVIGVFLFLTACLIQDIRLDITFDRIAGLTKGDRVLFEDNKIGGVETVQYSLDGHYTVEVLIEKNFANAVTQYSQFGIIDDPASPGHKAVQVSLSRQGGTPLKSGTVVAGASPAKDFGTRLQEELSAGLSLFQEQIEKFGRDLQAFPDSEEYKQFKKSLEDLATELAHREKEAREKIKQEWLPRIQKELDELREKLKQSGREKEVRPLEEEVEKIRRI